MGCLGFMNVRRCITIGIGIISSSSSVNASTTTEVWVNQSHGGVSLAARFVYTKSASSDFE